MWLLIDFVSFHAWSNFVAKLNSGSLDAFLVKKAKKSEVIDLTWIFAQVNWWKGEAVKGWSGEMVHGETVQGETVKGEKGGGGMVGWWKFVKSENSEKVRVKKDPTWTRCK